MSAYRLRVHICTMGPNCNPRGSTKVVAAVKRALAQYGLTHEVRVNTSGCLNQCQIGPNMVVQPDNVWYSGLDPEKAERIVREHLLGGQPVADYFNPAIHNDDLEFEDPFVRRT